MGKFIAKKTATGFDFVLKASNGEIIATSQVYTTRSACLNGIQSVKTNAPISEVEDQTVENYGTLKYPKFELYTDKANEYRFRLLAPNGEIIAIGQGYTAKESCEKGIHSVKMNAPDAETEDLTKD